MGEDKRQPTVGLPIFPLPVVPDQQKMVERNQSSGTVFCSWPDSVLYRSYARFLAIYQHMVEEVWGSEARPGTDPRPAAFRKLCRCVVEAVPLGCADVPAAPLPNAKTRESIAEVLKELRTAHGTDWLQSLASIFGMLLHLSFRDSSGPRLVNLRRPNKSISTYPTSPAVVKMVVRDVLGPLLPRPLVPTGHERRRSLHLALVDPSMESGQLLLGIAAFILDAALEDCDGDVEKARFAWRRICSDLSGCLWGLDRNPLARVATETMFEALGKERGIAFALLRHLHVAEAVRWLARRSGHFDAVLNNPPWGEDIPGEVPIRLSLRYSGLKGRVDSYFAFAEISVRALRRGGRYGLILPAQSLSASYAEGLRRFLVEKTSVEKAILLPAAVFAPATVASAAYVGRAPGPTRSCTIECLRSRYAVFQRQVSGGALHAHMESWWPLIFDNRGGSCESIPLGRVADVLLGIQLYAVGKGQPSQTPWTVKRRPYTSTKPRPSFFPAVQGRDVRPSEVQPPRFFVRMGPWLANPGRHATVLDRPRILVRELCRRDGKLTAAAINNRLLPVHGVHTIVPKGLDPDILVAILNSGTVARYVRTHSSSFAKADFQRITIRELRDLPIPVAAISKDWRKPLGLRELRGDERILQRRLKRLAQCLCRKPGDRWEIAVDSLVSKLRRLGARS
jgi:Eco57I restriction-modification methylase/TaqI-like C-terminal specificity domain